MNQESNEIGLKAINHIEAMLAYWDKKEICRFANNAYLDWFGRTQEEMVDKISMRELLGPLYEKNLPFIRKALEGETQHFEREIKTPSGEVRCSQASYFPDIANGEVLGFVAHVTDITANKKLEISLFKSEKKFKDLLEFAPDAIVIVNGHGRIQLVNQQAENIFGYAKAEMIGQRIEILIPDRLRTKHEINTQHYVAEPRVRQMGERLQLWGKKKNGKEFRVEVSLSPSQSDSKLLVLAAIRDISDRVESQQRLVEAKENLEILAARLTSQNIKLADFAHITSHNLRSPVANLNTLLNFYKDSKSEEEKNSLFNKFELVINHLSATLNTLVETLMATERDNNEKKLVKFEDVMKKTKEIIAAQIIESGAIIKCDFSRVSQIEYNQGYLESIFLNLLTNAIKYRASNRVPEIVIKSNEVKGRIVLTFADNGLGIDLVKHHDSLFGFHKTFHSNAEAKGVGLYLTKTQIENMGGTISAESEVGKGTTFTIRF